MAEDNDQDFQPREWRPAHERKAEPDPRPAPKPPPPRGSEASAKAAPPPAASPPADPSAEAPAESGAKAEADAEAKAEAEEKAPPPTGPTVVQAWPEGEGAEAGEAGETGYSGTLTAEELGAVLAMEGLLTAETLAVELDALPPSFRGDWVQELIQSQGVSTPELSQFLAGKGRLPRIDLGWAPISEEALTAIPSTIARRLSFFPFQMIGGILCLATPRVTDLRGITEVRRLRDWRPVKIFFCPAYQVEDAFRRYYKRMVELEQAIAMPAVPLTEVEEQRFQREIQVVPAGLLEKLFVGANEIPAVFLGPGTSDGGPYPFEQAEAEQGEGE